MQIGNKYWKKYCSKNGGRRRFQIDLAIELINHAIENEWENFEDDAKRPTWMRKGVLVPCDCNKCFFCKTGKTNGIYHKVLVTESKKTGKCFGRKKRKKNIQCTKDRQLLSNYTSGQYCRQCYRDQKSIVLTTNEMRRNCRFTTMGCPACTEPICDECWDNGYKNEYHRP